MKNIKLVLILILFIPMKLIGQEFNVEDLTKELVKLEIISEEEKGEVLASTKKQHSRNGLKPTFLMDLSNIFFKRALPDSLKERMRGIPAMAMMSTTMSLPLESLQTDPKKSKLLSQTLIDFNLIDEEIHDGWIETTKNPKHPNNDCAMLLYYSFNNFLMEEKLIKKEKTGKLINKCISEKILPDDFRTLYKSELDQIIDPVDLVKYMDKGALIELQNLSENSVEAYTEIYQMLSKINKEIGIKLLEFTFEKKADQEEEYTKVFANLRLEINDIIYFDTIDYDLFGNKGSFEESQKTAIKFELINSINQGLQTNNSLYKLYALSSSNDMNNREKMGFVFLEKDQHQQLKKQFNEFRIIGPSPSRNLNPKMIEIFDKELIEIGLIKESKLNLIRDSINHLSDFFIQYGITQHISYRIDENRNYTSVLVDISKIIGEEFSITPIEEKWDRVNSKITMEFELNGKNEKLDLTIFERKNDRAFFNRRKELLKSANLSKKFASLHYLMHDYGLGYFTDKQLEWIELNGDGIRPFIHNK